MGPLLQFDSSSLKAIVAQVEALINAADLGVTASYRGARYTPEAATIKFELLVGDRTAAQGAAKQKVATFAKRWDLPNDLFGKQITVTGKLYTVVDVNPVARKYPFVGERVGTGKRYRLSAQQVKRGLQEVYDAATN